MLGPTLLGMFDSPLLGLDAPAVAQTIEELAQLGVLLLMFYIGMEVELGELARVGNVGLLAGVGGSLLTVAFSALFVLYLRLCMAVGALCRHRPGGDFRQYLGASPPRTGSAAHDGGLCVTGGGIDR